MNQNKVYLYIIKQTKPDTMTTSDYTTKTIKVNGNLWTVLFAPTYISIRKETNNPFKTAGRQFNNIDEAIASYKSIQMKAALMQVSA